MMHYKLLALGMMLAFSIQGNATTYNIDNMNIVSGGYIAYDYQGQPFYNPDSGSTYTAFTGFGPDTNLVGGYIGDTGTGFATTTWYNATVNMYTAPSNLGSGLVPAGTIPGGPVPSGSLNDADNSIQMELGSLFASWANTEFYQGTGINDGITSVLATGSWNPNTGYYSLSWYSNIDPSVCGPLGPSCYAQYDIQGYATPAAVPLPAAIWLFTSGLMGFACCVTSIKPRKLIEKSQ